MKLEPSLERLIERYGFLNVLEALARICHRQAEQFGQAGKRAWTQLFQSQGFETSSRWHRDERALKRLLGELRHDEPTDVPAGRVK